MVELIERMSDDAVTSNVSWSDPRRDADRGPVCRPDRIVSGIRAGHVEIVKPDSGSLGETFPVGTVLVFAVVGRSWGDEVSAADPHILLGGKGARPGRQALDARSDAPTRPPALEPGYSRGKEAGRTGLPAPGMGAAGQNQPPPRPGAADRLTSGGRRPCRPRARKVRPGLGPDAKRVARVLGTRLPGRHGQNAVAVRRL